MSMSQKRARSPALEQATQIFKSSPIEDRSSTFRAVFSPTFSAESLQALPEFKGASHLMTAWRLPSRQRSLSSQPIFETGFDDDGESYGGKTLEKYLMTKKVSGSVMVARWYGGVMLGPVRFDHIRNCAGNAIAQWEQENERGPKRARTETARSRLAEILSERDKSIAVLRGLLSEKRQGAASSQPNAPSSQSQAPNYTNMELATLERLEQVRDKTIGWILTQIEQAEKATKTDSTQQILINQREASIECEGSSAKARGQSDTEETVHDHEALNFDERSAQER